MRFTSLVPRFAFALAACGSVLLSACDSSTTPAAKTLSSITVSPSSATLAIGGTQALTVTGSYSDNSSAAIASGVTFTSSAPSIATPSSAGVVTAVAAGSATITATVSGKSATASITVSPPVPTMSSIAITPTPVTLSVGATQQLTVTGTLSDATTQALTSGVTFGSSTATVASVSASGLVTAIALGTTTITATHTASGKTGTLAVTVNANGQIFVDDYSTGVSFVDFGGAANAVTVDAATPNNGRKSLKIVITGSGAYSGGAFAVSTARDLSSFNAVTFWAKASVAKSSLKVGLGNTGTSDKYAAEVTSLPLTTTFTKFVIPMPNPAKFTAANGLFHFADGPNNYTIWINDLQYEKLPVAQVGAPTAAAAPWGATTVTMGTPVQLAFGNNTVSFAAPALPDGGKLSNVSWRWFTLTSSNPAVATVDADGLVTGVAPGTATISASIGGITVAANPAITVVAGSAPTTFPAAPTVAAANVLSLFSSSYTNRGVDTWQTSWSAGNSALVDPFVIAGHNVKKYSLFNFVGIEFGTNVPANIVDASTMTHFHVDVWTPNPSSNLEIQLVNDATGTAAVGKFQAGALASGSWVSLEIPLASFAGLSAKNKLQQLLFVGTSPTIIYVDNIYFHK